MERLVRKTTAQQVAEAIELSVITGEFGRGSRLPPERRLAAQLGCCRPTAREGISRCVAKGLLVAVPGLGTFVTSVNLTQSIETTTSLYVLEKVPQKRIELVRHFLETRRALLAEVLGLACERCTPEKMLWVIDAFEKMGNTARFIRNMEESAEAEMRAIHVTAEVADGYFFWLMLNTLREFYRAARADLIAGMKLSDFASRSITICQFLRSRDADGVRAWVRREYLKTDLLLLSELESRAAAQRRKGRSGAAPRALPPSSPAHPSASAPAPEVAAPTPDQPMPEPTTASPVPQSDNAPDQSSDPTGSQSTAEVPAAGQAQTATVPAAPESTNQTVSPPEALDPGAVSGTGPPTPSPERPRCDPAAWHPWFVDWYRRNLNCNPWDNPDEQPPGSFFDDDEGGDGSQSTG